MNKEFYFCNNCSTFVEKEPEKICTMCKLRLGIWLKKQPRKDLQTWLTREAQKIKVVKNDKGNRKK